MQRMCFHRLLGQWRAAKLILKNSADATKTLDIEGAAFTATSVTFTVPADAEAGN